MGARKRIAADRRKEANKVRYFAKLNNCPTSPQKMRLVADIIRGEDLNRALDILTHVGKEAAGRLYKLVRSAADNFEQKSGLKADESELYVKTIFVDGGAMLKRIQPAPQGRAYRKRKRSNHVTVELDTRSETIKAQLVNSVQQTSNE
ncbi:MAG: 50S ribosomal protein L22 [Flavobacteriales bacterium]|nr:50S ribosomal protein L22 [Flavobacteriales bacterium]